MAVAKCRFRLSLKVCVECWLKCNHAALLVRKGCGLESFNYHSVTHKLFSVGHANRFPSAWVSSFGKGAMTQHGLYKSIWYIKFGLCIPISFLFFVIKCW